MRIKRTLETKYMPMICAKPRTMMLEERMLEIETKNFAIVMRSPEIIAK